MVGVVIVEGILEEPVQEAYFPAWLQYTVYLSQGVVQVSGVGKHLDVVDGVESVVWEWELFIDTCFKKI